MRRAGKGSAWRRCRRAGPLSLPTPCIPHEKWRCSLWLGQPLGLLSPAAGRPGLGADAPLWRVATDLLPSPEAPQKCTAFLWIFRFAAPHPTASRRRWAWMKNENPGPVYCGFSGRLDFLDKKSKKFDPQTAPWISRQCSDTRPADFSSGVFAPERWEKIGQVTPCGARISKPSGKVGKIFPLFRRLFTARENPRAKLPQAFWRYVFPSGQKTAKNRGRA